MGGGYFRNGLGSVWMAVCAIAGKAVCGTGDDQVAVIFGFCPNSWSEVGSMLGCVSLEHPPIRGLFLNQTIWATEPSFRMPGDTPPVSVQWFS